MQVYLLEATPRTIADPPIDTPVYFATGDRTTPLFYNGNAYPRRLKAGPSFDVNAFQGPTGLGGQSVPGRGDLVLGWGEDDADTAAALRALSWNDAPITVKYGDDGIAYGAYRTVLSGTVRHVTWDEQASTFTIHMRDLGERLNVPLQAAVYDGSGGVNGTDLVKNQLRPLVFGTVAFAEPKLIDAVNLVYQLHDGTGSAFVNTSMAVDSLYDKGNPFPSPLAEVGNVAALYAWTPILGRAIYDDASGLIRLGGKPEGVITAMVSTPLTDTASTIIQHVVKRNGTLTDADIASEWFDLLDAFVPAKLGLYVTDNRTIASVLDEVCATIGALWTFTADGKLKVQRLEFPISGDTIIPADRIQDRLQRVETLTPPYRVRVGYRKTWRVHTAEELIPDAKDPASPKYLPDAAVAVQYTTGTAADDTVLRTIYPLSEELVIDTLFVEEADATDQADRFRLALAGSGTRRVDRVDAEVWGMPWEVAIGDYVAVTHPAVPGGTTWNGVVLGVSENPDQPGPVTTLRLFG